MLTAFILALLLIVSLFCMFSGFRGMNCEVNIDDCIGNKCQNGSTCIDGINNYTCKCPPTYIGTYSCSLNHRCLMINKKVPPPKHFLKKNDFLTLRTLKNMRDLWIFVFKKAKLSGCLSMCLHVLAFLDLYIVSHIWHLELT